MVQFKTFGEAVARQWAQLSAHELFTVGEETDSLWETYLAAFPPGTNPLYKTKTEHDCSCCRNFVKNVGNAVAIIDDEIHTVWDVEGLPSPYAEVAAAMREWVIAKPLHRLFRRSEPQYGAESTRQTLDNRDVINWHHFWAKIDRKHFAAKDKIGPVLADFDSSIQVFRRGVEELKPSAFADVLDLIEQKALYRGEEHLPAIRAFQKHVAAWNAAPNKRAKKIYLFKNWSDRAARFRNTVIGTLIVDLSEGVDLDTAVKSFESKVAPTNYKRTTALITPGMVNSAMETINSLGLEPALQRRYATLNDIAVNNVLWVNNSDKNLLRGGTHDMLMQVAQAAAPSTARAGVEISVEDFLRDVAPKAQSMQLLVRNKHSTNFVSLTAPVDPDAPGLFRWKNNFGWSYDGNLTDSIREKVKRAGGNVEGDLRFSLEWFNYDDLDLHCLTPGGEHIFFGNKRGRYGHLDVDMNAGGGSTRTPVENIAFQTVADGKYVITVNQYRRRETVDIGFTVEIADRACARQLSYPKGSQSGQTVDVAIVTVKSGHIVDVKINDKAITAEGVSQEKWGVKTESWVPVQTVMYSPNHWDDQAVGNKHWFFMLLGCCNPETTRGIYNEFLSQKLEPHRKVFEVLGNRSRCEPNSKQLSGLGFSSTRGDVASVRVVVGGTTREYTVSF